MKILYRINRLRYLALLWVPSFVLITFGFINKGTNFLTTENLSKSRIFGENYVLMFFCFFVYFGWIMTMTIKIFYSNGMLLHKIDGIYYIYNKPVFKSNDVHGHEFEHKYFSRFLKINMKDGKKKIIPLIFSISDCVDPFAKSMQDPS